VAMVVAAQRERRGRCWRDRQQVEKKREKRPVCEGRRLSSAWAREDSLGKREGCRSAGARDAGRENEREEREEREKQLGLKKLLGKS